MKFRCVAESPKRPSLGRHKGSFQGPSRAVGFAPPPTVERAERATEQAATAALMTKGVHAMPLKRPKAANGRCRLQPVVPLACWAERR